MKMMKPKTPHTLLIVGFVVVAALAVGSFLGSRSHPLRQPEEAEEAKKAKSPASTVQGQGFSRPWPWGDAPIAYGKRVPLEVSTTYMRMCLCPLLPESGPASPEHVDTAWANQDGVVALEFDSGIKLAVAPDSELVVSTWISVAQASVAEEKWGRMVPLRGTQGMAYDRDEAHPDAIPSVKWVEGHALITVAGHGPQVVDDLVLFAENLTNPQISGRPESFWST